MVIEDQQDAKLDVYYFHFYTVEENKIQSQTARICMVIEDQQDATIRCLLFSFLYRGRK